MRFDQTALITGGASGIGRGMAIAFAREGMRVIVADLDAVRADRTASELRALGVEAAAEQVDVSDAAAAAALAARVEQRFGTPHVLAANAGVLIRKPLLESTAEDWAWSFGVNVFGVVNTLLAFLPFMLKHGDQRQVVVSASMAALQFARAPGLTLYSGSKHALVGIVEALRCELPETIAISILCPGRVATEILKAERSRLGSSESKEERRIETAGDTVMDPIEVGHLVVAALRDKRPFILTHPLWWSGVEEAHRRVAQAFREATAQLR